MTASRTSTHSLAVHRFVVFTAVCTFALIGVGGLVTSHGAGMAVPDWPNTYGYNMFLFPVSQWLGGTLYEHSHRLVASFVGLLVTIMAGWMWARETAGWRRWLGMGAIALVIVLMGIRQMPVYVTLALLSPLVIAFAIYKLARQSDATRWWGILALAAVILQGVLGGLRVVWMKDEIGVFHGALAQSFLVLMCVLALLTSRAWRRLPAADRVRSVLDRKATRILAGVALLIFAQLVLGATMRHQHAGLAIPDFPTAYGEWWPATDLASVERYNQQRLEVTAVKPITAAHIYLQMGHRITATLILAGVIYAAWFMRRAYGPKHLVARLGLAWVALILVQVFLGAWTLWSDKAADVATLHVLTGALSLVWGSLLTLVAYRFPTVGWQSVAVPAFQPSLLGGHSRPTATNLP